MSSGLASALLTSIVLHSAGLTALAVVSNSLWTPSLPVNIIPAELLMTPPPPAPVESVPPPEVAEVDAPQPPAPVESVPAAEPAPLPPPVTPPKPEKIIPPRLVEKTLPKPVDTPLPRVKTPVPPPPRSRPSEPPRIAQNNDKPRETQSHDTPQPGPPLPLPADDRAATAGNVLGPPAAKLTDTPALPPAEGTEAGAGKLFERGDAGGVPGTGVGGGGGGSGRAGLGTGGVGAGGKQVAGLQPGTGGAGPGGGAGALARPLGGYQVKPRYPESARRQGIAGTTLLKIHVSDRGRVEDVLVERSAGYQELDLAAMEAVKQWRFDPARQGKQPVAVWIMIPVRFELR